MRGLQVHKSFWVDHGHLGGWYPGGGPIESVSLSCYQDEEPTAQQSNRGTIKCANAEARVNSESEKEANSTGDDYLINDDKTRHVM